jgi:hypothetical protein
MPTATPITRHKDPFVCQQFNSFILHPFEADCVDTTSRLRDTFKSVTDLPYALVEMLRICHVELQALLKKKHKVEVGRSVKEQVLCESTVKYAVKMVRASLDKESCLLKEL